MNNELNLLTFNELIKEGIIPNDGNFVMTEEILRQLSLKYQLIAGRQPKYNKMSRRNSGLALLNLKLQRNIPSSMIDEGVIYLISNPAWQDYVKIGMTVNLQNRLSTYQTSDPHRLYKIDGFEFVLDRKNTEGNVLKKFSVDMRKGEWINKSSCDTIIRRIREEIDDNLINTIHKDRHNKSIELGNTVAFRLLNAYKSGIVLKFCKNSVVVSHDDIQTTLLPRSLVVIPNEKENNWKYLQKVLKPIEYTQLCLVNSAVE